ncbi:alpha/beta hydrolase family protein [Luteibaculum oceani]|uniref:Alpha/beta hydrolase n=1 Tax=Luteibaculum oceani TaxID=1294296 RepID=A0A5C6V2H1_9FLAO|nr:alpha/beta hydrolase [Luteibaculum oceani]TXC78686.1 alpha/beta hydrolase [Luteibaculum oceani]
MSDNKELKIIAFPGLGTDYRVFQYLNCKADWVHVPWKIPRKKDDLLSYARYLIEDIDLGDHYAFVGVSFGGMIASALSRVLSPAFTCIIASVKSDNEIPKWFRTCAKLPVWFLPSPVFKPRFFIVKKFLGIGNTKHQEAFRSFYANSPALFLKRSMKIITNGQFYGKPNGPLVHIHGTRDIIFPIEKIEEPVKKVDGTHFIVVTRAKYISGIINTEIERVENQPK